MIMIKIPTPGLNVTIRLLGRPRQHTRAAIPGMPGVLYWRANRSIEPQPRFNEAAGVLRHASLRGEVPYEPRGTTYNGTTVLSILSVSVGWLLCVPFTVMLLSNILDAPQSTIIPDDPTPVHLLPTPLWVKRI